MCSDCYIKNVVVTSLSPEVTTLGWVDVRAAGWTVSFLRPGALSATERQMAQIKHQSSSGYVATTIVTWTSGGLQIVLLCCRALLGLMPQ
jgi:hypothetical protein